MIKTLKLEIEGNYHNIIKAIYGDFPSGLRICLPMQGTRVRALVREDPTCRGATKPVRHNYWARVPQLLKPTRLEPVLLNGRSHRNEKPVHRNEE